MSVKAADPCVLHICNKIFPQMVRFGVRYDIMELICKCQRQYLHQNQSYSVPLSK